MQPSFNTPFNSPLLTDLYQLTMAQVYFEQGMVHTACFEFFVRELPKNRNYLVVAGIKEVTDYLRSFSFSPEELDFLYATGLFKKGFLEYLSTLSFRGELYAMEEGQVFFPLEPVVQVVAPIPIAQLLETRIINILQYAILVASKASRITVTSKDKRVVDFGLRRAHGGEAGLLAAKATYLAGFSGTSTVMAGRLYGIPIFGTMAHSFIQAHDNELEAFLHFARQYPERPIFLVDTYDTHTGIKNAIKAQEVLSEEGILIAGIRIDSGDIEHECKKAREQLDGAGMHHIKIIVSGDLDEYRIRQLEAKGIPIDGYGVGTRVTTSEDLPFLNCAYKLVEYNGKKTHKASKGKATLPGRKQVFRHFDKNGKIVSDEITPFHLEGIKTRHCETIPLLKPVLGNGTGTSYLPTLNAARKLHQHAIGSLPPGYLGLEPCKRGINVNIHQAIYSS